MSKPKPADPPVQVNIRMPSKLRDRLVAFADRGDERLNQTIIGLIELGLEAVGEKP